MQYIELLQKATQCLYETRPPCSGVARAFPGVAHLESQNEEESEKKLEELIKIWGKNEERLPTRDWEAGYGPASPLVSGSLFAVQFQNNCLERGHALHKTLPPGQQQIWDAVMAKFSHVKIFVLGTLLWCN